MATLSPKQAPDEGGLRVNTGLQLDPTPRTVEQVLRENFWLRELLEARIAGIEQRMDAGDKAVTLLQQFADRTPTTMDVQHDVAALREVVIEKFKGIITQINERDIQADKASRDVKSAVDAAFAAAKEAVSEQNKSNALAIAKSEAGVTKQLDMLGDANKTNMKGIDDKISDIKERIVIIESKTSVSDPTNAIALAKLEETVRRLNTSGDVGVGRAAGQAAMWALIVGALGLVFGLGSMIAVFVRLFMK